MTKYYKRLQRLMRISIGEQQEQQQLLQNKESEFTATRVQQELVMVPLDDLTPQDSSANEHGFNNADK